MNVRTTSIAMLAVLAASVTGSAVHAQDEPRVEPLNELAPGLRLVEGETYKFRYFQKVDTRHISTPSMGGKGTAQHAECTWDVDVTLREKLGNGSSKIVVTVTRLRGWYSNLSMEKRSYDWESESPDQGLPGMRKVVEQPTTLTVTPQGDIKSLEGGAADHFEDEDDDTKARALFQWLIAPVPEKTITRSTKIKRERFVDLNLVLTGLHVPAELEATYAIGTPRNGTTKITTTCKGKKKPSDDGPTKWGIKGTAVLDLATGLPITSERSGTLSTHQELNTGTRDIELDGTYVFSSKLERVED